MYVFHLTFLLPAALQGLRYQLGVPDTTRDFPTPQAVVPVPITMLDSESVAYGGSATRSSDPSLCRMPKPHLDVRA